MPIKHRSTAFNALSTLVTKFVLLFGGFIISILLARLLGPEGKGIVTAVFVFPLLIASLADMGIRQSAAFYIGKGTYKMSEVISSIGFLWIISSVSATLITLIYYYIGPSSKYPWIILLVALSTIPIKLISEYAKGIMLGQNQISTINIAQLLRLSANFMAVILLVWLLDLGVLGAAIVQVINAATIAVYYLFKVNKYNKISIKKVSPIPKLLFLKGFSFAVVLFVINLNYKIDIMILDYLVSPAEIGVYSVGINFAELLFQIPSAIGMILFAKSTTTKKQNESVERATTMLRIVLPIMLLSSIIIAVFAPFVIRVLYGIDFSEAGNVLRILLPGICFITISKILHPDLAGRGYPLFALKIFLITLVINIILNLFLIPTYGVYGAAISSTISYIIAGFGFGYLYSKRENIPMRNIYILKKSDINLIKKSINRRVSKNRI